MTHDATTSQRGREVVAFVFALLWLGGFGSLVSLLVLRALPKVHRGRLGRAASVLAWLGLGLCALGALTVVLASGGA